MKNFKTLVAALAVTMTVGLFAGCSNASTGTSDNKAQSSAPSTTSQNAGASKSPEVEGTITAAGSTALQPLADKAKEPFMKKNPKATVNVQGGGSGTGLTQVAQGAIEIGNSDITAEEKFTGDTAAMAKTLVDHKVCVVAFAPVVNSKVKIDNLTKEQVIGIFTGKITNWKDVGGDDMKIVVVNRPTSSGTRAVFKKYALGGNDEVQGKALTEDSSGAVKSAIEQTEGSIGYLASSYLNDKANLNGIKMLKFDGVEMNKENVTSGKYTIWSYEHMYTKGEAKDLTKAFLDYMVSDEVKPFTEQLGYYAIKDMKVTK